MTQWEPAPAHLHRCCYITYHEKSQEHRLGFLSVYIWCICNQQHNDHNMVKGKRLNCPATVYLSNIVASTFQFHPETYSALIPSYCSSQGQENKTPLSWSHGYNTKGHVIWSISYRSLLKQDLSFLYEQNVSMPAQSRLLAEFGFNFRQENALCGDSKN